MELKAYLTVIKRRFWVLVLTLLVLFAVALFVASRISPKYRAEISLRVQTPVSGTTGYLQHDNYYANRLMNTYARIANSDQVMEQLKTKLQVDRLPDLEVVMVPDSEIIQISAEDSDPRLAAQTVNTLGEILVAQELHQDPGTDPIDESITLLSQRLDSSKQEMNQTRSDYEGLIDPSAEVNAQMAVLTSNIRMKEQEYQSLQSQYQLATIDEMNLELPALKKKAQERKEFLFTQMTALQKELDSLNKTLQDTTAKSTQYQERLAAARQSVLTQEQAFQNLQAQYDSAMIAKSIRSSAQGLIVVSPAIVPNKTTGLQPWMILALGALVAVGLALLATFLSEALDQRVWSIPEVERLTGKPVIGRIPTLNPDDRKDLAGTTNLLAQQAFWPLRTRVNLNSQSDGTKVILVTSADPGEGKSLTISGLAAYLGKGKQKTLVVDGDLHRPVQHTLFKVTNNRGLTDVLSGKMSLEEAIHEEVLPCVDLLASGPLQSYPLELLGSPYLQTLLSKARAQYDFILIDSPALEGVTDAASFAQHVDGVFLIVRLGKTRPEEISAATRHLADLNTSLSGVIVTRVPSGRSHLYYRSSRALSNPAAAAAKKS